MPHFAVRTGRAHQKTTGALSHEPSCITGNDKVSVRLSISRRSAPRFLVRSTRQSLLQKRQPGFQSPERGLPIHYLSERPP